MEARGIWVYRDIESNGKELETGCFPPSITASLVPKTSIPYSLFGVPTFER